MAVRKVAVLGHPVLRKVAAQVKPADIKTPQIQQLIKDMVETMVEYDGRGLAAPQIHESLQIVVLIWDFDPKEDSHLMCLINPVLTPLTQETSDFWEGCLSVPGLRGKVARPNKVSVEALDNRGEKVSLVAEGFAATVLQHECDHLNGKVYVDRITDFHNFAFNREYQKFLSGDSSAEGEEEGEG